jgi:hypothetical protein
MEMNEKLGKTRKWMVLCLILPFILLMSGCLYVEVKDNVKNPDKYFREANRKIRKLERQFPDRRGPVSTISVLVYESSEQKIIRVEAPLCLIDACMDTSDIHDIDIGCDFNFQKIRDLKDLGPGMIMEADTEESRILIWIE